MIFKLLLTIVVCSVVIASIYAFKPRKHEYVADSRHHWRGVREFDTARQATPQNLLTIHNFMRRRGGFPDGDPSRTDGVEGGSRSRDPEEPPTVAGRAPEDEIASQMTTPHATVAYAKTQGEAQAAVPIPHGAGDRREEDQGETDGRNRTAVSAEHALAKHAVKDVVSGFRYFRGLFADAALQADVIAEKYLQFEEGAWAPADGEWGGEEGALQEQEGRASTALPPGAAASAAAGDRACLQELSRCRALERMPFDASGVGEDGAAPAEAEGRGKRKKKKKLLKKLLLPLLLSYKLKFFALVPVLISGLVLLVGSTGLAGFFFALFAAVVSIKHTHSH